MMGVLYILIRAVSYMGIYIYQNQSNCTLNICALSGYINFASLKQTNEGKIYMHCDFAISFLRTYPKNTVLIEIHWKYSKYPPVSTMEYYEVIKKNETPQLINISKKYFMPQV